MDKFFSHGKLLLTSEYMVLDGALALAVPTKLGQEFWVEEKNDSQSVLIWEAFHQNKLWLKVEIDYQKWEIIETNLPDNANFILKTLQKVQQLSETVLRRNQSYHIKTNLQFPSNFGLGSSSTLMNNLAQWAGIDAFQLNDWVLGGSGYDIAVAQESLPILYQITDDRRSVEVVDFSPGFKSELLFVYLNQKQDSREGIDLYRSKIKSEALIQEFLELTKQICICQDIERFSELMEHHEIKLAQFLGLKTLKEKQFSDCPVFIKSLGAWGGDFMMTRKFEGYEEYFRSKNYAEIFTWEELVLER